MDMTIIAEIVQTSLPVGLIVFGLWFLNEKLWPWFEERDELQRTYRAIQDEREHESQMATSTALEHLAVAVRSCPLKAEE